MGKKLLGQTTADESFDGWMAPPELHSQLQSTTIPPQCTFDNDHTILARIIETNIIPRLLRTKKRELAIAPPLAQLTVNRFAGHIVEFSELVINRDAGASIAYLRNMRHEGVSVEVLFQDLLAPTARYLGELWDEDVNDIIDVTRGLGHLQKIVHVFSSEFCEEGRQPISNRRALMMTLPGEQHTFGLALISEYFKRDGWRVCGGPSQSVDDILNLVQDQWFEIVGLSASVIPDSNKLASEIQLIRKSSFNTDISILVGGHVFSENPGLVEDVGADSTAFDGRQAVLQVSNLIGTLQV